MSPCDPESLIGSILGIVLCIGGTVTYIPQLYSIIKAKTIKGINELSLILLNIGGCCLALNSIIFNWQKWQCYNQCNFWACSAGMLPFFQILMGWIMVLIFYLVFMKYKIRNTQSRVIRVISYFVVYLLFVLIVIMLALIEKFGNHGPSQQYFFDIFAQILGYISAACSGIVWLPQIYTLWRNNERGTLSPLMFIFQTPGNIVIIIFQAVLFNQSISTWITYLITCIEQTIILGLIIYYYIRDRNKPVTQSINTTSDEDSNTERTDDSEVEPLIEIDKVF